MKSPGETDIDCGGPCSPCAHGKACATRDDCVELVCAQGICTTCFDGFTDGDETFVDCGGAHCPKCGLGSSCQGDGDCESGACSAGACSDKVGCQDGQKDNLESDVDCGGPTCFRCPEGKRCVTDDDCMSATCTNHLCVKSARLCDPGQFCRGRVQCVCDARSCTGCCDSGGLCGGLQVVTVCGHNGAVCDECGLSKFGLGCRGPSCSQCTDGVHLGCCGRSGEALPATDDGACHSNNSDCIVFSDATLLEMARHRPRNDADLLAISGLGPKKLARRRALPRTGPRWLSKPALGGSRSGRR